MFGGIELGGTKIVCGIANNQGELLDRFTIPTSSPDETLSKCFEYFKDKNIKSLGIASFGPIDLNKNSKTYGYITTTPKPGWENIDVLSYFKPLNIPLGFDTDVNGACLAEVIYGAGKGLNSVIYGTIGTGIGFGLYLEDKLIHGLMHSEAGHILLARHPNDTFEGVCPYHKNCFESLASGPAIEKRWGNKGELLQNNKEVWELESYYIAQALTNYIMCYSPQRIIIGGGVMHTTDIMELIRKKTLDNLNGYIKKNEILNDIDNYIVLPKLGDNAGVIGAIELGKRSN